MVSDAEKDWFSKRLVVLGKDLRKTNLQFADFLASKKNLESVLNQFEEITEKARSDPALSETVARELQAQQIFELFYDFKNQLNQLRQLATNHDDALLKQTVFLEGMRNYRFVEFQSQEKTLVFLAEVSNLYSIGLFLFKPQFMGLVSFVPLQKELSLEKKDEATFLIPSDKLARLFEYLAQNKFLKNFRLDSPEVKILCQSGRTLKIEAANSVIKRLDRVVLSLEGKVLDN